MKKINTFITLLISLISFSSSAQHRGDILLPLNCMVDIYTDNNNNTININDFTSQQAGALASTHATITIILKVLDCSIKNDDIKLTIDPHSIDPNTGYLKNNILDNSASQNVAFQLFYDDEERAINLNNENTFITNITDGDAEFYFAINYVKTDNLPPKPGKIQSNIIFNLMIDEEIVEI
ncbi:MAG TPA: fimbrial protein [Proteus sp.]|nr:fimbrial protein [Proteus sp. (in: enterobacteria)]